MPDAHKPPSFDDWSPESFAAALSDLLVTEGQLDHKALERAVRLADEAGARIDQVFTQLGLVSERNLAEAMARLLALRICAPGEYPDAVILGDRLRPKFLRK